MDTLKQLVLVDGTDKSDSIESVSFSGTKCNIVYKGTSKTYGYSGSRIRIFSLQRSIDPGSVVISVHGEVLSDVQRLLDFGEVYKILFPHYSRVYAIQDVTITENCLTKKSCADRFEYFKHIAGAVSLTTETGANILAAQYERIKSVGRETALSSYLADQPVVEPLTPPDTLIYPFGLNQSQKKAVENAFSSQVSIIQGPPGTGKTQTILNIIANAVIRGQKIAVVSSNNSATHNVVEKLRKKQLDFLTAFLGSRSNKDEFLKNQSSHYPDMSQWLIPSEVLPQTEERIRELTAELDNRLNDKNRIAEIDQELLSLIPERRYFDEYYRYYADMSLPDDLALSSEKNLALWNEYEAMTGENRKPGLLQRLRILFKYHYRAFKLFRQEPERLIPYLQNQFYIAKEGELRREREQLEQNLLHYSFEEKLQELTEQSLKLFRHTLAKRYHSGGIRPRFDEKSFYRDCRSFTREYPIILSTTYSIKSTLNSRYTYDYLIVDEASQVDLATGVLALSCAKNIIIVGDSKQLPNVLTDADKRTAAQFRSGSMDEKYDFTRHSLLSSAIQVWEDAPSVLLREHYRCHPKIINFCNQKFYDGKLIIMTKDHGEENALSLYYTNVGNHARGHMNQREIDIIQNEVLPKLYHEGYQDIGVITPYRDQVRALKEQLRSEVEIDTVHKFQGREKDAIILSSVDNVIGEFVDDYHMLNVAVSRAVNSLTVVTAQNPQNDHTNYGDLARYISYHNFAVINSKTYSVFDLLYKEYAQQRAKFLQKHKRVSEYDSENLMYAVLEKIMGKAEFRMIGCAVHVSLATLIRDYSMLTPDEAKYAGNPLTHTDFLLFNKMDKSPILAIEVDGTSFHAEGSIQAERDRKKDHIFEVCGIRLLRLRTDASGEEEKIETALHEILN